MKKNMGTADRAVRLLVAVAFAVLYFMNIVTGTLGIILLVVGVVFALTAFVSFCPLYTMFKLSTAKKAS